MTRAVPCRSVSWGDSVLRFPRMELALGWEADWMGRKVSEGKEGGEEDGR